VALDPKVSDKAVCIGTEMSPQEQAELLQFHDKNNDADLTFYKMMKATLQDQVGRNVLSYVDDIVVASKKKASYISDLTETCANMHEAKLKLNQDKWIETKPVTNVSLTTMHKFSGKTSSVVTEFHNKSQSTTLSTLIATCLRISITR
jgi:hypothetical protein